MDRQRGVQRVEVRAVISDTRGRTLLIRRVTGPDVPWEFPGGPLPAGTLPEEGLRRRCLQELGLELAALVPQPPFVYGFGARSVTYFCFVGTVVADTAVPSGCAELRWVSVGQLPEYALAPPDRQLAERLLSG